MNTFQTKVGVTNATTKHVWWHLMQQFNATPVVHNCVKDQCIFLGQIHCDVAKVAMIHMKI